MSFMYPLSPGGSSGSNMRTSEGFGYGLLGYHDGSFQVEPEYGSQGVAVFGPGKAYRFKIACLDFN